MAWSVGIAFMVVGIGLCYAWPVAMRRLAQRYGWGQSRDGQGWYTVHPGPASWPLAIASLVFGTVFAVATVIAVFRGEGVVFWLLLGPTLVALFAFGVVCVAVWRIKVSDEGVRVRTLQGWRHYDWWEVIEVTDFFGTPKLRLSGDRHHYFWPYGFGDNIIRAHFAVRERPYQF